VISRDTDSSSPRWPDKPVNISIQHIQKLAQTIESLKKEKPRLLKRSMMRLLLTSNALSPAFSEGSGSRVNILAVLLFVVVTLYFAVTTAVLLGGIFVTVVLCHSSDFGCACHSFAFNSRKARF
jgi:hypothetical protein